MAEQTIAAKPMTDEERKKRYAELRGRMEMSRIYVEPPAGTSVRWVRKDDSVDISKHEWMGFKIVIEDPKLPSLARSETPGMIGRKRFRTAIPCKEDGTYILGDVILMEIPTEDYEFFLNEGVERSRNLVDAGKKNFLAEAEKLDVPAFERDKSGNIKSGNAHVRR